MRSADVLVVGAGVIGASIAYNLARDGADVLLADRAQPPAGSTASGSSAGGVRQQGRVAPEIPLAIESIAMWAGLADELGMDIHYHCHGMTFCVDDPRLLPALHARVARERAAGLEIRVVEADALRRMLPCVSPRIVAGSYCPTDGHADPMRTTRAFSLAAERHRARVLWDCDVRGFRRDGDRITGAEASAGPLACRTLVLTAGAATHRIAARGSVALPMLREGFLQMMVTAPCPPMLRQVLAWVGHGISLKQAPSGGFVIGGGWPGRGDVDRYETHLIPGAMAKSAGTTVNLVPALAGVPVVRAWIGIESYARDE
ncbi:MAG: FAD-binding oxidoreductase [Armatimonadetes bacterium]|nr:FAD-binding oxidoreductase [Armatimonadota bacterium]